MNTRSIYNGPAIAEAWLLANPVPVPGVKP